MNGAGGISAEVEVVEELGADAYAFCVARPGGVDTKLIARTDWRRPPAQGAKVVLRPRSGEAHAFDPETGERLGG
jgi:multiple sugar transport system ATP-binding protein